MPRKATRRKSPVTGEDHQGPTYCRLTPSEVESFAELLEVPKVHLAPHPSDRAKDDPPGIIVNVSGFTIPCSSATAATKLQTEIAEALEPILKRNSRRLRSRLKNLQQGT